MPWHAREHCEWCRSWHLQFPPSLALAPMKPVQLRLCSFTRQGRSRATRPSSEISCQRVEGFFFTHEVGVRNQLLSPELRRAQQTHHLKKQAQQNASPAVWEDTHRPPHVSRQLEQRHCDRPRNCTRQERTPPEAPSLFNPFTHESTLTSSSCPCQKSQEDLCLTGPSPSNRDSKHHQSRTSADTRVQGTSSLFCDVLRPRRHHLHLLRLGGAHRLRAKC